MDNVSFGGIQVSKRKSLREEVYDSLRKSILHGKLKAGQRLIEEQLAHQIGISRTPVREAFHKLEKDDWSRGFPKEASPSGNSPGRMWRRSSGSGVRSKVTLLTSPHST